jgi:hypothetical protein
MTWQESEPCELIYFKAFKKHPPTIEQNVETASLPGSAIGFA